MFGLSKFRSRRRTPKEKPKNVKRRKPIPIRSHFRLYDDPRKPRTQRYPTPAVIAKAEQYRAQRFANPSAGEVAFDEILRTIGIAFERERIFYRTGSFIIVDFYVPSRSLVFEVDGSQHTRQIGYDAGRDQWIRQAHGVRTCRISAATVLRSRAACQILVRAELGL
jgi:very-short-patch-repair endonuclease